MMNKRLTAAIICVLAWSLPAAAQPLSKSMAECAALFGYAGDYVNRPDRVDFIAAIQAKWINAAVAEAQGETVDDPAVYVGDAMTAKLAEWRDRGILGLLSQDYRDWMDYCSALAQERGLTFDPV